jgi:uncharacterized protein YbcI
MAGKETPRGGQALVELSNAMVALHREYFGRGPGAAKSFVNDEMVVCVLSDIYTAVERITGRSVRVFLSQVDVEANLALEFFIFAEPESS